MVQVYLPLHRRGLKCKESWHGIKATAFRKISLIQTIFIEGLLPIMPQIVFKVLGERTNPCPHGSLSGSKKHTCKKSHRASWALQQKSGLVTGTSNGHHIIKIEKKSLGLQSKYVEYLLYLCQCVFNCFCSSVGFCYCPCSVDDRERLKGFLLFA